MSRMKYQSGHAIGEIFTRFLAAGVAYRLNASCAEAWRRLLRLTTPEWQRGIKERVIFE